MLSLILGIVGSKLAFFLGAGLLVGVLLLLVLLRQSWLFIAAAGAGLAAWLIVSGIAYVEKERRDAHAAGVAQERAVWVDKSEKAKAAADMAIAAAAVEGRAIAADLEATILGLNETLRLNDEAAALDPDRDRICLGANSVRRLNSAVPGARSNGR